MTSYVFIEGFEFRELDEVSYAKSRAREWLNNTPIEWVDDKHDINYEYVGDWDERDIQEHCQSNEYLFDINGNPIHSLVITEFKPPNEEKQDD